MPAQQMVRRSKVLLWLVVLPVAAGLVATSIGLAEPYLSPSDLPVSPMTGAFAGFGVVLLGTILGRLLDTLAWRRMGECVGLTPEGFVQLYTNPATGSRTAFANPVLSGSIDGQPVQAYTYQTGDGDESSVTHTVVESGLSTPVEWHGVVTAADDPDLGRPDVTTAEEDWRIVDGEVAVWGPVPDQAVQALASPRVSEALADVDYVAIGDVGGAITAQLADALADSDGAVAGLAGGVLDLAGADEGPEASEAIRHDDLALVLDDETIRRRAAAVAAVADAIERHTAQTAD